LVVETGTYNGVMAREIGRTLKKNGHGRLITFEVDHELHQAAERRCRGLPVDLRLQSSLDWEPTEHIDFCWLDSGLDTRVPEFNKYYPFLKGSFIGIHDTGPQHQVRDQIESSILDRISPIWLPTPRGVMLAQVL
jgi:predicted O-methyltransferase YrrM